MNSNDSEKLKKDLITKLLSGDKFAHVHNKSQEKPDETQNIKYRSYTPWTTLQNAARAYKKEFKITYKKESLSIFETNDLQSQYIFDAAFIKCIKYICNDTEKDFDNVRDDVVLCLQKKHVVKKSLYEVIELLRKLRPDDLEDV